ncbi:MAG: DUF4142 domain-containing protein [Magnetovibrionaceae bacterium]
MKRTIKQVFGALALVCLSATPGLAGDLDDETIFAIFDQANMADIATGRLGWTKGHHEDVRALARMVVTDHTAVQQMGRDLAAKLDILGTPPANDMSWGSLAKTLADLSVLSGPEFDAAYLRHEVAFHSAVIEAVRTTLLPSIEDEAFKGLVVKVLPGFEHHLAETKATADRLGLSY